MALNFRVNLAIHTNETIGTIGSERVVGMLPPITLSSLKEQLSTWIPDSVLRNINLKDGDTFTVENDIAALYIRNTYAKGYCSEDRAWLEVV